MRNGICASLVGNFNEALRNQRTGNRRAQKVFTLVDRVGAKHREYKVSYKGLAKVLDIDLVHAQSLCFGSRGFHLFTLTNISRKGHYFALIGFL